MPTLQFVLGVAVSGEAVSADQLIGFAFVRVALAVLSIDNLRVTRHPMPDPVG